MGDLSVGLALPTNPSEGEPSTRQATEQTEHRKHARSTSARQDVGRKGRERIGSWRGLHARDLELVGRAGDLRGGRVSCLEPSRTSAALSRHGHASHGDVLGTSASSNGWPVGRVARADFARRSRDTRHAHARSGSRPAGRSRRTRARPTGRARRAGTRHGARARANGDACRRRGARIGRATAGQVGRSAWRRANRHVSGWCTGGDAGAAAAGRGRCCTKATRCPNRRRDARARSTSARDRGPEWIGRAASQVDAGGGRATWHGRYHSTRPGDQAGRGPCWRAACACRAAAARAARRGTADADASANRRRGARIHRAVHTASRVRRISSVGNQAGRGWRLECWRTGYSDPAISRAGRVGRLSGRAATGMLGHAAHAARAAGAARRRTAARRGA